MVQTSAVYFVTITMYTKLKSFFYDGKYLSYIKFRLSL